MLDGKEEPVLGAIDNDNDDDNGVDVLSFVWTIAEEDAVSSI